MVTVEANKKFRKRFTFIERELKKSQIEWSKANAEMLEDLWQKAKRMEG